MIAELVPREEVVTVDVGAGVVLQLEGKLWVQLAAEVPLDLLEIAALVRGQRVLFGRCDDALGSENMVAALDGGRVLGDRKVDIAAAERGNVDFHRFKRHIDATATKLCRKASIVLLRHRQNRRVVLDVGDLIVRCRTRIFGGAHETLLHISQAELDGQRPLQEREGDQFVAPSGEDARCVEARIEHCTCRVRHCRVPCRFAALVVDHRTDGFLVLRAAGGLVEQVHHQIVVVDVLEDGAGGGVDGEAAHPRHRILVETARLVRLESVRHGLHTEGEVGIVHVQKPE